MPLTLVVTILTGLLGWLHGKLTSCTVASDDQKDHDYTHGELCACVACRPEAYPLDEFPREEHHNNEGCTCDGDTHIHKCSHAHIETELQEHAGPDGRVILTLVAQEGEKEDNNDNNDCNTAVVRL